MKKYMEFIKLLMKKRDKLMDKYAAFMKRSSLTEEEIVMKNAINQELIHLDFEIEKAKYDANIG